MTETQRTLSQSCTISDVQATTPAIVVAPLSQAAAVQNGFWPVRRLLAFVTRTVRPVACLQERKPPGRFAGFRLIFLTAAIAALILTARKAGWPSLPSSVLFLPDDSLLNISATSVDLGDAAPGSKVSGTVLISNNGRRSVTFQIILRAGLSEAFFL